MVARSVVMLAALSTRTVAFVTPSFSRTGCWTATRRISHGSERRTRVGRLLAVDSPVDSQIEVSKESIDEASSVKSPFLRTLVERGFYHQCTNVKSLDDALGTGEAITAYLGFDATADRYVDNFYYCTGLFSSTSLYYREYLVHDNFLVPSRSERAKIVANNFVVRRRQQMTICRRDGAQYA